MRRRIHLVGHVEDRLRASPIGTEAHQAGADVQDRQADRRTVRVATAVVQQDVVDPGVAGVAAGEDRDVIVIGDVGRASHGIRIERGALQPRAHTGHEPVTGCAGARAP